MSKTGKKQNLYEEMVKLTEKNIIFLGVSLNMLIKVVRLAGLILFRWFLK